MTRVFGLLKAILLAPVLYVLLPLCVPLALFLVWQGVPQTFMDYVQAKTLLGADQSIPLGPAALRQVAKALAPPDLWKAGPLPAFARQRLAMREAFLFGKPGVTRPERA